MKEVLIIKNFSVLKDINIELNNFNLIIGEQASGKSLIAKMIFFFKEVIFQNLIINYFNNKNILILKERIQLDFKNLFPEYFWEYQNFEIIFNYKIENTFIKITKDKNSIAPNLIIIISERIEKKYKEISTKYLNQDVQFLKNQQSIQNDLRKIFNSEISLFTPASRSIFSLIKDNIFSLNMLGVANDFFITQFGTYYEKFKRGKLSDEIKKYTNLVLNGEFQFDSQQNEIFLYTKNQKSKLKDSSTGQQELVPIFMLMNAIINEKDIEHFLIIEEPESHIFPKTQKELIDFFAFVLNYTNKKTSFLLTTHSPYVILAISNLIQASNTSIMKPEKVSEIIKIIPKELWIDFKNVSLFYLKNGELKYLNNNELQNIEAEVIDDISIDLSSIFDKLLDIKYNEE
jgi:predicted ATPase